MKKATSVLMLIMLFAFIMFSQEASAVDFSNLDNPPMTYNGYTYQHIVYGHYGASRYVLLTDSNAVYDTTYNSFTGWFHVYFNANHEIFFGGCDGNWQNCNNPYYGGDYGVYLDHSSYDFGVSVPVDLYPPPPGPQLTVSISPSMGGMISSSPTGLDCSAGTCQGYFEQDSDVTLTANPSISWAFAYWDDGTSHITDNPHVFTMDQAKTVTAVFRFDTSYDGATYTDVIYGSYNGNYYIGLFNRTEIVLRQATYSDGNLHFWSDRYYYGNLNDDSIHAPLFGCTDNTFTDCWLYGDMIDFGVSNVIHSTYDFGLGVPVDLYPTLKFPLSGSLEDRGTPLLSFGDTWTFAECPTGVYKKHAGIDLNASESEEVYAAHNGTVKAIYTGQHAQWADAIVIESDNQLYTTVYWHVIKYGDLAVNDYVAKGQQIATVADLGTNTHFHFGFRSSSYNSSFSLVGALPEEECGSGPTYPAFPENFIDPTQIHYE